MYSNQTATKTFDEVKTLLEKDGYAIKKSLGKGAFGEVFLVERGDSIYAVKSISKSHVKRRPFIQKYIKQEMEAMKILKHPHLVRQERVIEHQEYYFMILEYCDGGNLLTYQSKLKNKVFPLMEAIEIVVDVMRGLKVIHESNYIHRDIKSENVLIKFTNSGKGRVFKIADFGFARPIKSGSAHTVCGTEKYMAPEILENMPYNISVDLWAVGVLLFFMLFAEYPFRGLDILNDVKRKCSGIGFNVRQVVVKKDRLNQCNIELEDFFRRIFVVDYKKRITFQKMIAHPLFRNYEHEFVETRHFYNQYEKYQPALVQPQPPEEDQDHDDMEPEDATRSALLIGDIMIGPTNKHLQKQIECLNFQINKIIYIKECSRQFYENYKKLLNINDRLAIRYYLLRTFLFYANNIINCLQRRELPKEMAELKLYNWREFSDSKQYMTMLNDIKSHQMTGSEEFEDTYSQLYPIISQIQIKYFSDKFTPTVTQNSFQDFKVSYRSTTSYMFKLIHENKSIDSHLKNKIKIRLFCCHMINRVFDRAQMDTNFQYYVKWTKSGNMDASRKYDFANFKKWILVETKENLDKNILLLHKLFFSR